MDGHHGLGTEIGDTQFFLFSLQISSHLTDIGGTFYHASGFDLHYHAVGRLLMLLI